mgnify:CR=1 FL=1
MELVRCTLRVANNYFFFQAEDGIRDYDVTGVQTCALPISQLIAQGGLYARLAELQFDTDPAGEDTDQAARMLAE